MTITGVTVTHDDLIRTVTEAVRAHDGWPRRLRRAVAQGGLAVPADAIACGAHCGFGQWLDDLQADPDIAHAPEFRRLVTAHTVLHVEAGRIAAMVEAGDCQQAHAALCGPSLEQATRALSEAGAEWSAVTM